MKFVSLPDRTQVPALGLGTWRLGEAPERRAAELLALRTAFDLGYRLFDTAEMYADGRAEELLGEALAGRRHEAFIVSKVLPQNSWVKAARAACERSLKRLGTDYIDLYLLHWREQVSLPEVLESMERLVAAGKIRRWGVSNFDTADLKELWSIPDGNRCAVNQVWYSLGSRAPEFDLLPWQREHRVPLMAYCPLDEGRLALHPALTALGRRYHASAAQLALAWLLFRPDLIAIPQTVRLDHLQENLLAQDLKLEAADLADLDRVFQPPRGKQPLAVV
jgi:diketogulonate reductase-like aldo/keto reductase